jgi:hypothetical protein
MDTPVYDPRARKWHFNRQRSGESGFRLSAVTAHERIVRPSVVLDDPGASTRHKPKRWWTRCLVCVTELCEIAPSDGCG